MAIHARRISASSILDAEPQAMEGNVMRRFLLALTVIVPLVAAANEPLTESEVKRFADALETLVQRSEQYDSIDPNQEANKAAALGREYEAVITDHGFTMERWQQVTGRVYKAMGAIAMERDNAGEELAKARKEIRNNPNLSDAQKKQMLKALEQQKAQMKEYREAPDKGIVEPYFERLKSIGNDR
jgi:phosphoenolpyruvate-protein kinase (PTS system EI component)